MSDRRSPVLTPAFAAFVTAWLAVMVIPPLLLLQTRSAWLEQLDQPGVQEDWDAFRRDMQAQSGAEGPVAGPVKRKVPRSAEPPLRVWLRDYVWLAIAAWVLFGSVLFGFMGLAIGGSLAKNQPRGGGDHEEQHQRDGKDAKK